MKRKDVLEVEDGKGGRKEYVRGLKSQDVFELEGGKGGWKG